MSDSTSTLQEAYELIELGKLAEAREILKPYVENHPSPDVLWVYMHAVEDPNEGKRILSHLNAIAPDYPGVRQFNSELDFEVPQKQATLDQQLSEDSPTSADHELEDFADNAGNDRRVPMLAILLSVFIVLAVILVLVNPFDNGSGEQPSSTQVAENITDDESITPDATTETLALPTTEAPTDVSQQQQDVQDNANSSSIEAMFADFDLSPTQAFFEEDTELGNTRFVRLCSVPGPVAAAHIANAMNVFAAMQDINTDAVGVVIQNCDTETDLRYVAVSVSDLTEYATGEITESEFNRLLRPVR